MTNAYIYIRYSDAKQAKGTSYDRQLKAAKAYCAEKQLTFVDDEKFLFFDDGVSAFDGSNVAAGSRLAKLYEYVDDGTIPKGSYLLVENLDRLSREDIWTAGAKFTELIAKGIVIVTLMKGTVYNATGGLGSAFEAFMEMDLANKESDKKSGRVRDSWTLRAQRATQGNRIKIPLASWLEYGTGDIKYKLKEPQVSAVRRIFELCTTGYGMVQIAKRLEEEGFEPFRASKSKGKKWITATITGIIKNTAVIGTYTPDRSKSKEHRAPEVQNFFPRAVTDDQFYEAQAAVSGRRIAKATNQSKKYSSIWQGIAKCTFCGSAMHCLPKGQKMQRYLVCSGKISGLCTKAKNVRADASEAAYKELLVKVNDSLSLIQSDKTSIMQELRVADGRLLEQEKLLQQHTEAAEVHIGVTAIYGLIAKAEAEVVRLTKEKEAVEQRLIEETILEHDKTRFFAMLDLVTYEKRQQANALLKRLGITVRVSGGTEPVYIAVQAGKDFLQLVSKPDGVVVVPLNKEQREKFVSQDRDGSDIQRVDEWLAGMGMFSKRAST